MSKTLSNLLVKARQLDKYIPVKHLVKHGLNECLMIQLEDEGLLTVIRNTDHGMLFILTPEGYRHFL